MLLGTTLLAFVSILGSAYVKSFNQLIATRVFNGLFPAAFAPGPAIVMGMFFVHQRGRAMGSLHRKGVSLRAEASCLLECV